ncbi:MAG: bifunctional adenosylcobinamide kinase/adenosylcobinamide-phosphate guanylyltransferase [Chloroflexi bacterium]|nr:MAG: bifunctional adenosylcobinamide kinase/adenosylcobinamide-phosphate guanylyltransferase [Chloroflexota bacterium]MBL1194863.1 bifunctional adenosylcobinamide kinase/adenosylcobinamide-phosphate guanylyltransferase [Chloroflexota bacterium]NOH12154.1 bifunctional adenosylcobinamide kinase/adenosylcobinamide-phosphate guanylyltransferase [Chloroflexota bacterium]
MGKMILLVGGARSGKSNFAEKLAEGLSSDVTYLATAEAGDEEMKQRIADHQVRRPATWQTREITQEIASALKEEPIISDVVLMDCITLMVTNILLSLVDDLDHPDGNLVHAEIKSQVEALVKTIKSSGSTWIVVSNEVGSSVVPAYPVGRIYRDAMGWVNQTLARSADEAYYLVAGNALTLNELSVSVEEVVERNKE